MAALTFRFRAAAFSMYAGQTLEDDVEDTARLTDLDEVGEEVVEDARDAAGARRRGSSRAST